MSSHHPNKTSVPSWLIPAAAITFSLLLVLIVSASRPCSASCHDDSKTEKKEHSSAPSTNGQGYVTVEGPDGHDIKVSSKLSGMIGYLFDENANISPKENNQLQEKVEGWKEKMSHNNTSPSFSNFLDIIELSKALAEK